MSTDLNDYLWTVVKPKNGERHSVDEMNTKLLAFDPKTPAKHDDVCRKIARGILETEHPSIAEIFRREVQ